MLSRSLVPWKRLRSSAFARTGENLKMWSLIGAVVDRVGARHHQARRHQCIGEHFADGAVQGAVLGRVGGRHLGRIDRAGQGIQLELARPVPPGAPLDAHMFQCTCSLRSPGRMRKFTVASARPGSTLSLLPAFTMVSAVVVRNMALVLAGALELLLHHGAEEPEVGQRHPGEAAHLGRQGVEHLAGHAADAAGQLVVVQALEGRAQHGDGAAAPLVGGMEECPGVADTLRTTER